ncbi:alginate O-acetyltransferase [Deinococcus irradiatisoli]|uniref:Alginate O-acetyltransferase n=1 Tax=Deinococcus irradiatisoli TaxID=2202254 RepID=A0A2Z3JM39_9DEIO|nr:DUF4397 domain-containing protein [Deinococcus irradiatisoli]AWN22778.1 alginate O-acetyltransferase [Deinococcus irradiatisoli]
MIKTSKTALIAAALMLSVSAAAQSSDAYVRVVHAVADAPAVDVYVDGTKTVSNAPFKAVTPYGNVPAGSHDVKITAAGDPNTVVFSGSVDLKAGTYYTVAAVGYLANLKPKIFTASGLNTDPGQAEINVYHLSPDGPRVQALAVDMNNTALLPKGLAYGNMASLKVSPMAVNLNIVPFGQTTPVVKNVAGISVAGSKSYSLFALGTLAGKSFDVVATEDKLEMGSMSGN